MALFTDGVALSSTLDTILTNMTAAKVTPQDDPALVSDDQTKALVEAIGTKHNMTAQQVFIAFDCYFSTKRR